MAEEDRNPVDAQERFIAPIAETAERMGMGLTVSRMDRDRLVPIYANPLIRELVGLGDADVQAFDWSAGFSTDSQQQIFKLIECRYRGDLSPRVTETSLLHLESRERIPVEMFSSIWERDGQYYIVAFFRDIRSRKEAEDRLKRSEERFRIPAGRLPGWIRSGSCRRSGWPG